MRYLFLVLLLIGSLYSNEKISIQLKWYHQFQFAGFYIAKEKGFYQDVGLDVTIKEIQPHINIIDEVVSGNATYGIGSSSLLIARNAQKPIIAISAIFQHSPSVLITTDPMIDTPADFKNKRMMISSDIYQSAQINAILQMYGISKEDITIQKHSYECKDLINGNTDIYSAYLTNEPYFYSKNNIEYSIFDPKDYGFDFYGDILFTSEEEIKNHPSRVKAFYEATKKGWLWAFEHIEETSKLILDKYNTNDKSLEHLIYEGQTLKKLAFDDNGKFGLLSEKKFKDIGKIYQLNGFIRSQCHCKNFLDPLNVTREKLKIGVLAKRGSEKTIERWQPLADYLNLNQDIYSFEIVPLDFEQIESYVHQEKIDFVIVNTMYYVMLDFKDGISRIATLVNNKGKNAKDLKEFGGVIFTTKNNDKIKILNDIKHTRFGAVDPRSFGGWIMGYSELQQHGIEKDDFELSFFETHDNVVHALLEGKIDAGTVRTDTLEKMAKENRINMDDIKIIAQKNYENFPYVVSTKLYPEWPFAILKHTDDFAAKLILPLLINMDKDAELLQKIDIAGWTIPQDYSSVNSLLKELKLPPYDHQKITLRDIFDQYKVAIILIGLAFILILLKFITDIYKNILLKQYNKRLNSEVRHRTKELNVANRLLKKLAQTDSLTGIYNYRKFIALARKYFSIAKRNKTPLQVISLDLDFFKNVNDTYGHQAGDEVLKQFTQLIQNILRQSDIFGRLGGEEFSIVLQNTSYEGAITFAEKIRTKIEETPILYDSQRIHITVSIGIAQLSDEKDIDELMKKADIALYKAKNQGRNSVVIDQ